MTVIACICASSCRTYSSLNEKQKKYTVEIQSKTPGLMVYTVENGVERKVGVTPCTIYSEFAKVRYVTVEKGDIYQTIKLKTKCSQKENFRHKFSSPKDYLLGTRVTGKCFVYTQKKYFVDL